MTKKYSQLTQEQRYQIEALRMANHSQSFIANAIGVHKSTICRELQRNTPKRGKGAKVYHAAKAQRKTAQRHLLKPKRIRFTEALKADMRQMVEEEKYSPELVAAQWAREGEDGVSHETIYKYIFDCKKSNKKVHRRDKYLYKHLKHSKRRRKRGNYKDSRGLIPNRTSIEQRPEIVNKRIRPGDMEVDLIIGKNHKSGLLVTIDRATLLTTIDKIESRDPKKIQHILLKRLGQKKYLKTITFDNDQAFSLHQIPAQKLNVKTFFTRPYTSQDKGSIENRNGVIRRFFPKKTDFNPITKKEINNVENKINNRPIRKFGYKTAFEVHLQKTGVALIA